MKRKVILFGTAFILGMGVEKSFATPPVFLLTIDDSNPSAVTITATGENPVVNDTGQLAFTGVDLVSFFTQGQPDLYHNSLPNSTLESGSMTLSYDTVSNDSYRSSGPETDFLDLHLSRGQTGVGSEPETFSTTQPAFTGSWTIDFSSLGVSSSALPEAGSQGQILSGNSEDPGAIIGSWQVVAPVPEPGTGSFWLLGSAAGFIFWRHRARKGAVARA